MQQFVVPQFIDVEDKIIGPVTVRQFIIMLFGFMLIALCYKIFDFSAFLFFGLIIFAVSGIISFTRINGMAFHFFILNFIQTSKRPSLRVWDNRHNAIKRDEADSRKILVEEKNTLLAKYYDVSRLAELALIADTHGTFGGRTTDQENVRRPDTAEEDARPAGLADVNQKKDLPMTD